MSRKQVVFIVGAPGVGKTTAISSLLDPWFMQLVQKPKWTLSPPYAAVGHYGGNTFGGGDTVPYDGAAEAVRYWSRELLSDDRFHTFIFDGDRFSSDAVLAMISVQSLESEFDLRCIHITASQDDLDARRAARGSKQNEAWMRGRATKARRFAEKGFNNMVVMDTSGASAESVADTLKSVLENHC